MIKEIVDIGRVSNKLGSVFTFKDLPEYYVEVILKWNGRDFILNNEPKTKHLSEDSEYNKLGQELYLKYGVHRGKKSSTIYIFPSSFIYESKEKSVEQMLNFLTTETKYSQIKKEIIEETFEKYKAHYQKLSNANKELKKKYEKLLKDDGKTIKKEHRFIKMVDLKIRKSISNNKHYKKISKYYCSILENIALIDEVVNTTKSKIKSDLKGKEDNRKINNLIKRIPIIVKIENGDSYSFFYENTLLYKVLENIEFQNSANFIDKKYQKIDTRCNIYPSKKALVYPSGGFYYPFSTDKVNVKYNLKDDKNLFLLSKEAYIDFLRGRTFLETYNNFYFMGLNSFITATALNDEALEKFQKYTKNAKANLDGLIELINKNISNRFDIMLNFYFYEPAKTGGGKEIIEYVKDIIPSYLVQTIKLFDRIKDKYKKEFNRSLNFSWQQHIYHIFYKDNHKKYRTTLFREMALGDRIDLEWLMRVMNDNMQYSISKPEDDSDKYYWGTVLKHYIFLNWLNKINKGETIMSDEEKEQKLFVGKSYEEKLSCFLEHANMVKESNSMKLGVSVGLMLQILSWKISNYGKKSLAFVGKRIERNNLNSVQVFVNEIFAKTRLHGYESLQSINVRLATLAMVELDDSSFNKDEFIFGLFLGYELYKNVKGDKDPEPEEIEGENDEQNTTGGKDE